MTKKSTEGGPPEDNIKHDNNTNKDKNSVDPEDKLLSDIRSGKVKVSPVLVSPKTEIKKSKKKKSQDSDDYEDERTNPDNESTELWEMIKDGYFFADLTENVFFVDRGVPIEIGSDGFLDGLTNKFYEINGKLPSPEALNSVKRMARFTAKKNLREVQPRVSRAGDAFIYDPLKDDGAVYIIGKEGIKFDVPSEPHTVRFKGMLMVEAKKGTTDDLNTLLGHWNITDDQKILLIGDIGASLVPGIPQTIIVVTGQQGSGKTTLTKALKEIVDPNAAASTSLRADQEVNLVLTMLHQRVTAFDNVNGLMPQWVSDILCSAATGNGFRTRQLYTNSGEFVTQIQRKIIVNGINESNYNGDFQERSLHLHLSEIDTEKRISDKLIQKELSGLIPKVRGLYLNKMVDAINTYEDVSDELNGKLPRMADYTIWGECFVRAMGFDNGSFLRAFQNAQDADVMENSTEDITVRAIYDLIMATDSGEWKGTTSDLLQALIAKKNENKHGSEKLPNTPRKLGRRLTQIAPMLRKTGIELDEEFDSKLDVGHKVKVLKWREKV